MAGPSPPAAPKLCQNKTSQFLLRKGRPFRPSLFFSRRRRKLPPEGNGPPTRPTISAATRFGWCGRSSQGRQTARSLVAVGMTVSEILSKEISGCHCRRGTDSNASPVRQRGGGENFFTRSAGNDLTVQVSASLPEATHTPAGRTACKLRWTAWRFIAKVATICAAVKILRWLSSCPVNSVVKLSLHIVQLMLDLSHLRGIQLAMTCANRVKDATPQFTGFPACFYWKSESGHFGKPDSGANVRFQGYFGRFRDKSGFRTAFRKPHRRF